MMSIPTNSEAWETASPAPQLHKDLLGFLIERSTEAFTRRELSDEFLNTGWEEIAETERLRQELEEEEYERRLREDELPDSDRSDVANSVDAIKIDRAIDRLTDLGLVECREVEADAFEVPYEWDTVIAFSISPELA